MTEEAQIKRVVGLKYEPREGPPKVILKGAGRTAEQVIEQARQMADHKIVEDKKLLEQLFRLPVDAAIDADLFQLVAVLLVHVYTLDEALQNAEDIRSPIAMKRKMT